MNVNYDIERAKRLIDLLKLHFKDYESSSLASIETPENIEPGSERWIYYVFYSCLLDYGMNSKLYHERLKSTFVQYSRVFDPIKVREYDDDSLLKIIKSSIRARYPNVALKKWRTLSSRLENYPNIKKEIEDFKTLEELVDFIDSTGSYGQKTGNLLLRVLIEAKVCEFDSFPKTIPLDRHDLEICHLTRITDHKVSSPKEIDILAKFLVEIGHDEGVNSILLDKYLWEIGNKYCNNRLCETCPLSSLCKRKDRKL